MPFVVFSLILGLLALEFDYQIADAMNQWGSTLREVIPKHLRWPNQVPPWSMEQFENCLSFVRWWGAAMVLQGFIAGLLELLR